MGQGQWGKGEHLVDERRMSPSDRAVWTAGQALNRALWPARRSDAVDENRRPGHGSWRSRWCLESPTCVRRSIRPERKRNHPPNGIATIAHDP